MTPMSDSLFNLAGQDISNLMHQREREQMNKRVEVIVVGGGQAGLSISYYLTQQGREHLVLEQGRIAESWLSKRWNSFHLVSPNWEIQLPGFPYQGNDPDGFLSRAEVAMYFNQYVASFNPPLSRGVPATSLRQMTGSNRYLVSAGDMVFEADKVVVATGAHRKPKIPVATVQIPSEIFRIHTSQYRNPQELPMGDVLVIGSGQSGCQIAEELHQSGRRVYLSVGSCPWVHRSYYGKDVVWWMTQLGLRDKTVETLPSPNARFACNPQVTGKDGGRDLNVRTLAKQGVTLLGGLAAVDGDRLFFATNLQENLAKADKFERELRRAIDKYLQDNGAQSLPVEDEALDPIAVGPLTNGDSMAEIDLKSSGIKNLVWGTGFEPDYRWIQVPVFDGDGHPVQKRGVTKYPGLYFLGLNWQHKAKSALLAGVGQDAAFIAEDIEASAS
jgi:putative flavoprotein involved in K+ transport